MPTQFKLKSDSLTRRAVFAHNPSWAQLSAKIASLFALPQHQVAVTYLDAEDEEITLSSEEELQDYYLSSFRPGDIVKFSVRDLSRRSQAPEQVPFRNTFGQFPDIDIPGLSEWQSIGNVPSLEEILGHSEAKGAYVETVPSETDNANEDTGDVQSEASEPLIPIADKGKDKGFSQSPMTSTRSLLAEDEGDKYPVHVYDVSAYHPSADSSALSGSAVPAQSTPRAPAPPLDNVEPTSERKSHDDSDPPLPPFEDPSLHSTQASAGLAQDIASFLNIVSNIVSSHPEIGESLRTIAHNTSNGTYWTAHRDAISQAAAEFQRNTGTMAEEGRRMAETEAGRRIAEAFASVLNIFSHAPTATQPDASARPPNSDTAPPLNETTTQSADPVNRAETPSMPGAFSSAGPDARFGGPFPFSGRRWRPPVPMPPDFAPGRGHIPPWARHSHHGPYYDAPAHQGPSSHFTNAFAPAATPNTAPRPEVSVDNEAHERPSPQDLKAKVEEAKRMYKAEKERYRKDRDERRREKEQPTARNEGDLATAQNDANAGTIPEIAQIATNARHDFPRFDIVNVTEAATPRLDPPLGPSPRRPERPSEDLFARAVSRISRRLADMGFTEKSHPDLPQKIKNYLPADGAIARESEDDIVTSLLEAMLNVPKSPVASGSRDVPGGWP